MNLSKWLTVTLLAGTTALATAQSWSPQKNVEIVAASAPGGSNDNTARLLERVLTSGKLVGTTLTVVNKPGGSGTIAHTYVSQRAGDPHVLGIITSGLVSNHINGLSTLTAADFTPIAMLTNDYVVFAVSSTSSIRTGKDLIDKLRQNPRSVSIAVPSAFGTSRHIAAGLLVKSVGGNPRDLKPVVFKGSAEAIPAVLGGHLDLVVVGAGNAVTHVNAGRMRVLAVAAPQRLPGALSNVPTWKEHGIDLAYGAWRAMMGPKGLTPAQVGYWENALRKVTEAPEWKADLERNYWTEEFITGAELKKAIDRDYVTTRAVLVDLGLAK
jgi:putative tricarboxylic transport membrane protein